MSRDIRPGAYKTVLKPSVGTILAEMAAGLAIFDDAARAMLALENGELLPGASVLDVETSLIVLMPPPHAPDLQGVRESWEAANPGQSYRAFFAEIAGGPNLHRDAYRRELLDDMRAGMKRCSDADDRAAAAVISEDVIRAQPAWRDIARRLKIAGDLMDAIYATLGIIPTAPATNERTATARADTGDRRYGPIPHMMHTTLKGLKVLVAQGQLSIDANGKLLREPTENQNGQWTQDALAEEFNVSRKTVRSALNKYMIELADPE